MIERRQHKRFRTLEFGKATPLRNDSSIDCIVRNLSFEGACLQFDDTSGLPEEFHLKIPIENLKLVCRVIWRSQDRVGVAFRQSIPNVG